MELQRSAWIVFLLAAFGCGSVAVESDEGADAEADLAPDSCDSAEDVAEVPPDVEPDGPDVEPDVTPDVGADVPDAETDSAPEATDAAELVDHPPDVEPSVCPDGMALVPAGPFVMGSDPGEGGTDELPEHVVQVSAYCIDLTEITAANYAACVTAGTCTPPSTTVPADRHPAAFILYDQALAYCAWSGRRLPTEAEWEKAARGGCELVGPETCGPEDERTYPWGEATPTCELANHGGCGGASDPVGTHPRGDSPYGVHDLAGNVWEWVSDWYSETYYATCPTGSCTDPTGPASGTHRPIRGGSWFDTVAALRTAFRDPGVPNAGGYATFGFRCASRPLH